MDGVDDVLPTLAMARNGRAVYEALDELRNAEAGKDVTLDGPDEGTCPRESAVSCPECPPGEGSAACWTILLEDVTEARGMETCVAKK